MLQAAAFPADKILIEVCMDREWRRFLKGKLCKIKRNIEKFVEGKVYGN